MNRSNTFFLTLLVFLISIELAKAKMVTPEMVNIPTERLVKNLENKYLNTKMTDGDYWLMARAYSLAAVQDEYSIEKKNIDSFPKGFPTRRQVIKVKEVFIKKAIESYAKAIELNPNELALKLGRGWCYLVRGEKNLAISDLKMTFEKSLGELQKLLKLASSEEKDPQRTFNPTPKREVFLINASKIKRINQESFEYLSELLDKDKKTLDEMNNKSRETLNKIVESAEESMSLSGAVSPIIFPMTPSKTSYDSLVANDQKILFDLDGRGKKMWSWLSASAGILVFTGNDPQIKIVSGRQLFGNVTFWFFWNNGYEALSALDDNGDGTLRDKELKGIAVWNDKNRNGISESREILSLEELGIVGLKTAYSHHAAYNIEYNSDGIEYKDGTSGPSYDWISTN